MSFAFKGYQRTDYIDPDSVSATEALALVQNGEVRAYNAWDLLHRVGLSGDTTFVEPPEKEAEAASEAKVMAPGMSGMEGGLSKGAGNSPASAVMTRVSNVRSLSARWGKGASGTGSMAAISCSTTVGCS